MYVKWSLNSLKCICRLAASLIFYDCGQNVTLGCPNVDSGSCLCHMRGATMLFAVSQISQRLLLNATDISHSYFVWIFLSTLALALLYVIVMFAALLVLHFTHSMTSHRMLPFPLPRVLSYAFTRNFCGWQLVQNYCSEKVSRFLFSPSSFPLLLPVFV